MKREAYKSGLLLDLGFLLLLGVSMMGLGWIGYHGVDDLAYAIAAADWATEGPGLGANHWALRYPVVFPTSISFWVFGINELALVLPSILSFLGIIGLTYSFLRTHFDRISGLAAGVLVATTPQFSNYASWAGVELIEVLLVSSSLWLFATAPKQRPVKTLLLSGLVAGLAWSTRETAVSILVLYGVCFVLGYRYTRTQYLAWAAGFIGVIGLELLLLGLATGNPLYRWELDLAHVHCTPNDAAFLVRTAAWNWITAPLAVLAGDGAHGLLYLLAIISGGFLLFRNLPRAERQVVFLFIALALIHYVIVGHVAHLRMARYYAIITYVAVLVLGITFSYATRYERLRMAAYLVMVTLLASSLIVTGLRSGDRTFAARTVADFVMDERTQVYTDLRTRRMATFFFLDNRPLTDFVRSDPPPPGAWFFFDFSQTRQYGVNRSQHGAPPLTAVPIDWEKIAEIKPETPLFDLILEATALRMFLPNRAKAWRDTRRAPVILYRTPEHGGPTAPAAGQSFSRPARCDPWLQVK